MSTVLIGAAGQLGTDLARILPDCVPLTHADIEITDPLSVRAVLDRLQPDVVVNTAAYNLVDKAEDDVATAYAINEQGPRHLAMWCAKHGTKLVHVSTDYVFGAETSRSLPYEEVDAPGPLGEYGRSKLAGELAVARACERHLIVRTCGLYGRAATKSKGNFVQTMLRLAGERPELRVVNDQHCTPSFTGDVASMIAALCQSGALGTFHVTNAGATTWYDVAREAIQLRNLPAKVVPIPSSEYPTKAQRPRYSVLNCRRAEEATGLKMPHWRDALARYLDNGQ